MSVTSINNDHFVVKTVNENPHQPESLRHGWFSKLRNGMTVADYREESGIKLRDLKLDIEKGYIKIVSRKPAARTRKLAEAAA